jgi:DIM1 family U5 snRNP protein
MGSLVLPNLASAWHVDQAILSEGDRVVVIRFGKAGDPDCLRQDDVLSKVAERVKNFAVIYLCDIDLVPDFNTMYELYDPMTIMVSFPCLLDYDLLTSWSFFSAINTSCVSVLLLVDILC